MFKLMGSFNGNGLPKIKQISANIPYIGGPHCVLLVDNPYLRVANKNRCGFDLDLVALKQYVAKQSESPLQAYFYNSYDPRFDSSDDPRRNAFKHTLSVNGYHQVYYPTSSTNSQSMVAAEIGNYMRDIDSLADVQEFFLVSGDGSFCSAIQRLTKPVTVLSFEESTNHWLARLANKWIALDSIRDQVERKNVHSYQCRTTANYRSPA